VHPTRLDVQALGLAAELYQRGPAETYRLPNWASLTHDQKIAYIRNIAEQRAHSDPLFATLVARILRALGVPPRKPTWQAAALLRWVQDPANVYYLNEPGERLQDPIFTLRSKVGDCDDMVILLATLFTAAAFPWRCVLSGKDAGGRAYRYVEGQGGAPPNVRWDHIYLLVGTPPLRPTRWYFCEPTLVGAPLGWDVISGSKEDLPSGAGVDLGSVSSSVGTAIATEQEGAQGFSASKLATAVLTGVAVAVGTQLTLDWLRGKNAWEGRGLLSRLGYGK
jgi:hypothetical protein